VATGGGALGVAAANGDVVVRILVGLPLGGDGIPPACVQGLFRSCAGWPLRTNVGRTDINRNYLCQVALDEGYEAIAMLDTDMVHPADIVERLAQRMKEAPRLVVAGLGFRRRIPYDPLAYLIQPDGSRRNIPDQAWQTGKLVQVDYTGTGAIIIARKALETIKSPWFRYPYEDGAQHFPSEDMWFCEKCREARIGVYVDTGLISAHLGQAFVTGDTRRAYLASMGA
jgi:hypothetical protein